jgi:hypothetical protein
MKYWYIHDYTKQGEPIWNKAKAFGYRRKNGADQVFVKTLQGFEWIFANIVKEY